MNKRITDAGIKIKGVFITIGEKHGFWTLDGKTVGAYLEYNGKTIIRPKYEDCERIIKEEFNLNI